MKAALVPVIILLLATSLFSGLYAQEGWGLDSCIRYAYVHNPGLKMNELNVELSRLNRRSAVGGTLPSLNAQATHGYNWGQRIDPFTNQFATERVRSNNLGISTSVNLFNGFQQVNQVRQADLDVESGMWNLEKAKNDLALNVASAYLTVLLNQELLSVARFNLNSTEMQLDRIRQMVSAGQMAEGSLDQMLSQLAADKSAFVAAENNAGLALLNLTQIIQLEEGLRQNFKVTTPAIEELVQPDIISNPELAVTSAMNNFPEVKGAKTGVASAAVGEAIARGARYPRLTASYSYGTGYSGASRVLSGSPDSLTVPIGTVIGSNDLVLSFPQPVFTGSDYSVKPLSDQMRDNVNQALFFNLTIPIFNGFSAETGVRRAEINRKNAEYRLEQTTQQLRQQVERAYADARAAGAMYQAAVASREANEKSFRWLESRFNQGLVNQSEYGVARNNLDVARSNESRQKFDYVFKTKVLEFYMGKPISLSQ